MRYLLLMISVWSMIACRDVKKDNVPAFPDENSLYPVVFMDPDFRGRVELYTVSGKIELCNSIDENDDFDGIQLMLIGKKDGWYDVSAWHTLNMDFIGSGQIKSSSPIAVYSRQYQPSDQPLKIYNEPDIDSPFVCDSIYDVKPLRIIDFRNNKWVKVRFNRGQNTYEGWIPPEEQCSSVYTTCN